MCVRVCVLTVNLIKHSNTLLNDPLTHLHTNILREVKSPCRCIRSWSSLVLFFLSNNIRTWTLSSLWLLLLQVTPRKACWTRVPSCRRRTPSASSEPCARSEERHSNWARCSVFKVWAPLLQTADQKCIASNTRKKNQGSVSCYNRKLSSYFTKLLGYLVHLYSASKCLCSLCFLHKDSISLNNI